MPTAEELRRQREETSAFSRLFDYVRGNEAALAAEGRRPVFGGLLSKEPVMGVDTIRYEGIGPMLAGLLEPVARGVDAPRAAAQGLIPAEDMISEAFGTAGSAMLGGGAMPKPKGSLGANTLRVYHGTDADISQLDPSYGVTARDLYTTPARSDAAKYGKNVLEFDVDGKIGNFLPEDRGIPETKILQTAYSDYGLDDYFDSFDDFVEAFDSGDMYQRFSSSAAQDEVVGALIDVGGFDAIRIPDAGFGGSVSESVVAQNPNVFKPVMANASKSAGLLGVASDVADRGGPVPTMYSNPLMSAPASIDGQVAAARKAWENSSNDSALLTEYKRLRNLRDEGSSALPQSTAPAPQVNTGLLSDYVGQHRAPMRDEGAPAFDLAGDIYPDDIYSPKAVQYYGTGSKSMDRDTVDLLQSLRGEPDADVTIYRAVPRGVDRLNAGDWVTVNKQYALDHGEGALGGDFDIVERTVKAKDIFTNGDSIHEFGYDPSNTAANASKSAGLLGVASDVADRGDAVLNMLKSGRGSDVTNEMLDMGDSVKNTQLNQYLFKNYDLPLDEASRMARARELGHNVDREFYRGGGTDRTSLSADAGTFKTQNTGVFMDPNPMRAETYAKQRGGVVAPLLSRSDAPIVFGDMSEWNRLEAPSYAYDPVNDVDIPLIEQGVTTTTDDIARAARQRNLAAIEIQDVMDPGPMRWRNEDKSIREYPQFGTTRVEFDPANIRSRFARFDPRLAHLSNLTAANASPAAGLLSQAGMSEQQAERTEKILQRMGLLD